MAKILNVTNLRWVTGQDAELTLTDTDSEAVITLRLENARDFNLKEMLMRCSMGGAVLIVTNLELIEIQKALNMR
jgi:hypothetical protein